EVLLVPQQLGRGNGAWYSLLPIDAERGEFLRIIPGRFVDSAINFDRARGPTAFCGANHRWLRFRFGRRRVRAGKREKRAKEKKAAEHGSDFKKNESPRTEVRGPTVKSTSPANARMSPSCSTSQYPTSRRHRSR